MALKSNESPNVQIREIDLSGVVPAPGGSVAAMVGAFNWGPAHKPVLVGNEAELVKTFWTPLSSGVPSADFMSVAQFLKYSSSAYVTRIVSDGDVNAVANEVSGGSQPVAGGDDLSLQYVLDEGTLVSSSDDSDVYFFELPFRDEAGSGVSNLQVSAVWKNAVLDKDGATVFAQGTDAMPELVLVTPSVGNSRLVYMPELDDAGAPVTPHPQIVASWVYDQALPTGVQVKNSDDWEAGDYTPYGVVARHPGSLGNSISVEVCSPAGWGTWTHASKFTSAPEGSEVHVAVLLGGDIVEKWEYLSTTEGVTSPDGSALNVKDVINAKSDWIWVADFGGLTGVNVFELSGGANGDHTDGDYVTASDAYADVDSIVVDFLVSPSRGGAASAVVTESLLAIAESRKDCVVVASPYGDAITASSVDGVVAWADALPSSSYLILDGNWVKVYNKYLDKYETIAAASSTAGIMSASDRESAPWFSPAGQRRGQYLGVTSLAMNPSKSQRDTLYAAGVNPIVSQPGQGTILFGDKTHLSRPSAFDRINVRRLFLAIERSIAEAGKQAMFEFNDEFTRAEFVNIVEPFLREIQGRRGITDFRVVCDETNNTPAVVDRNEFIASVFVKPARSINYVTLNFVAVRTGVEFEEVVGTV
jgi:hypothetical protein